MSDIYSLFMYLLTPPPSLTKNHLLCSIPIKIDQIWEIGYNWRRIWYSRVRMTSVQNSVVPKFRRGGAEKLKSKKLIFFKQTIGNPKLCIIPNNQPLKSIRNGDMSGFFFFDFEKEVSFPYLSSESN